MRDRAATARQWPVRNARWCGPRLPVVSASMALHMPAEVLSCPRQGGAQRRKDYRATGQMCTPPKQTTLCEVPTDGCQHCLISFSTIGSSRMFPCWSPVCVFVIESMSHRTQGPWVLVYVVPHASWTSLQCQNGLFLAANACSCRDVGVIARAWRITDHHRDTFVCFLAFCPITCSTHPCTSLAEVLAMIPQGLLSSARLVWAQASAVALPGVTSLWPRPPIVFPLQPCLCQALACTRCVGTHGKL